MDARHDPAEHTPVVPPAETTEPVTPVIEPRSQVVDLDERKTVGDVTLADLQQLRWGPIFAGLLTAVGIFVLLTLPAIALGLQAAPGQADVDDLGPLAIIVASAIAVAAFFAGGFIATWTAGISDPGRSLVNGFLVWALWLATLAILATLGVSTIAGAMGELFGQISEPAIDVEEETIIETLRSGSWRTFLALALTAAAASLGGVVGAREELRGAWTRVVVGRFGRQPI